jgi:hypothetical protein
VRSAVAAVMLACSQAMAAEIKEDRSDSVVTVTGEIVKGDSDKFDAVVHPRYWARRLNSKSFLQTLSTMQFATCRPAVRLQPGPPPVGVRLDQRHYLFNGREP